MNTNKTNYFTIGRGSSDKYVIVYAEGLEPFVCENDKDTIELCINILLR